MGRLPVSKCKTEIISTLYAMEKNTVSRADVMNDPVKVI